MSGLFCPVILPLRSLGFDLYTSVVFLGFGSHLAAIWWWMSGSCYRGVGPILKLSWVLVEFSVSERCAARGAAMANNAKALHQT